MILKIILFMISTQLPTPSEAALKISQELLSHIFSTIRANQGHISFAQYMELALYAPGLGYYSNGAQKFGADGDFVTAPEISPFFSKCLATQCQEILQNIDQGNILEIGAGSGQMAADILTTLAEHNSLPNHYFILELSADLKARQQEKILQLCPELMHRVTWLNKLPKPGFKGIILGNELLDAMPVHRFQIVEESIQEIQVVEKNNALQCELFATEIPELLELYQTEDLPLGYHSEINLNIKPWISSIADIISTGVVLLIDYGFPKAEYYHPDRDSGTLMCHYRHYAHQDPFLYPGLQDITAHVDFTAIAEAAHNAELDILGYCSQAAFLLSLDLMQWVNVDSEQTRFAQNQAINVLTSPAEMGELFKVIALGKAYDFSLKGFHLNDRRYTL
jgi:SAM-dependent MidA family methyltransferase